MAKNKNNKRQSETMGKISAINTLLERYPVLTTTDPMLSKVSINTSLGFLLEILTILGVTKSDIIKWLCKILGGEDEKGRAASDGLLNMIEYAIKGILMINVRDILTCAINPNLPDNFMKYAHQGKGARETWKVTPIKINLTAIDLFGLLNNCPSNEDGGIFYFDAYESEYIPNDLYKSQDFNAFLWYVINKGDITNATNTLKNTWDNRIKASYTYNNTGDIDLKDAFFFPDISLTKTGPNITIKDSSGNSVEKKQYIICDYQDSNGGEIDVYLNADRYYQTRKIGKPSIKVTYTKDKKTYNIKFIYNGQESSKHVWLSKKEGFKVLTTKENPNPKSSLENKVEIYDSNGDKVSDGTIYKFSDKITMNRTIFEFNYDYIYSLKLFDTKTLLANICNSLLGLGCTVNLSLSFEQQLMKEKIGEIVKKIIKSDDTDVSDCYFTFSNDEYNTLLNKTTQNYSGKYTGPEGTYNPAYGDVMNSIRNINSPASRNKNQKDLIGSAIESIMDTTRINQGISNDFKFNFDCNFIYDFLQQTITEIILQVLSPKVAILYAVNSAIVGQVDKIEGMENLLKDIQNVIISIVKQAKDILIKELYNYMMEQLSPILQLFISKIALETIKAYKDLIMNLILNCIPILSFGNQRVGTMIDNINYADIVPKETSPEENKNC